MNGQQFMDDLYTAYQHRADYKKEQKDKWRFFDAQDVDMVFDTMIRTKTPSGWRATPRLEENNLDGFLHAYIAQSNIGRRQTQSFFNELYTK